MSDINDKLQLSVRARRCMTRLNINTIGELLGKTPDDLMDARNFGIATLNEVREKLDLLGLSLLGDKVDSTLYRRRLLDEKIAKAMDRLSRAYAGFLSAQGELHQAKAQIDLLHSVIDFKEDTNGLT